LRLSRRRRWSGCGLGVAPGFPLDDLDDTVSAAFAVAIDRLEQAGARISREAISLFDDMQQVNAYGGNSQPEAGAVHRERLTRRAADIDPSVRARIERG
jgi:aspartyl-tRNA(Asn)/glutamyl-tRNA(Gln) amidotransferase subunit A